VSKAPEAFRTISEVARDLDLPQHVLRFWETRFTHIRPMKRGGGRRYYRPDDIDLLRGIRTLLYGEGYTIRGVQRILKEHGPRFVIGAGRGEFASPRANEDIGEDLGEDDVADDLPIPPVRVHPSELQADDLPADDIVAAETEADEEMDFAEADEPDEEDAAESADDRTEPTFDPREFRPAAHGSIYAKPAASSSLGSDDIRRLQATLGELLELKRLLDQARG
jgi:DNA-binding transcriptional MerR regulator